MKKILLFLLAFLACAYSAQAQAQEYIYIAGSGSGLGEWTEPNSGNASYYGDRKLNRVSENVFEGTFTLNGSVYFRFYTALNGWSGTHCLGASSNNRDITGEFESKTFGITSNSQNVWLLKADGSEYVINVNLNTNKLAVSKKSSTPDPDPTYPDIYLRGEFNSWGKGNMFKNNRDGTYSMTVADASTLSGQFKLASEDWSIEYTNGDKDGEKTIGIGETLSLYSNSNKKKSTFESMSGAVTIDLKYIDNSSYVEVQMTISEQGTTTDPEFTKYYLRGDINGWGTSEDWELKTTDGLTYTLNNVTLVSGQQFKIGQAGDKNWVGYGYSSTDGELSIYPDGTAYDIYKDNSGNLKFDYVYDRPVNITFTLPSEDSNSATLKVVYVEGAEITYPTLYLRGNFSGEYWATNDAYIFTQSGDVYTLTVNGNDVKNNEWVIATDGYTYNFGVSEAITVTEGTKLSWNKNNGAQAGFGELEDAKYVLEYTYSTQTLKVTKQGAVVTYPHLWLRGDFNNWGNDGPEANTAYKFTCTDGVYTLNDVRLSNNQFKIGSEDWKYGFGGATVAANENDVMSVNAGEPCTIYNVEHGKNLYIGELTYHVDITFTPNKDFTEGTLKITLLDTSGINGVEIFDEAPVEFYNLQGVRVDGELTPGLYIRRQGGNASKILIR